MQTGEHKMQGCENSPSEDYAHSLQLAVLIILIYHK
jgi:hypothetical protein